MSMITVHDVNINVDDNCNDCCPCIPKTKKAAKPKESKQEDQKKVELNEKVNKAKCAIG